MVPAGGTKRKKNVELTGTCIRCGVVLAIFNLRGAKAVLEAANVVIEMACVDCDAILNSPGAAAGTGGAVAGGSGSGGGAASNTPGSGDSPSSPNVGDPLGAGAGHPINVGPSGLAKKKRSRHEKVDCEVCKRAVGAGRVRCADENAEADFTVEVVCQRCKGRFGFCTECGGGGKYRTGKYRPVELFPANRKTCLLSHVRIGKSGLEYQVYSGGEVSRDSLHWYGRIYMDAFLSLYATPRVMEEVACFNTFSLVRHFLRDAWQATMQELLTPPSEKSIWYAAGSWINSPQRKKKGSKSLDDVVTGESDSDGPLSPPTLLEALINGGGSSGGSSPLQPPDDSTLPISQHPQPQFSSSVTYLHNYHTHTSPSTAITSQYTTTTPPAKGNGSGGGGVLDTFTKPLIPYRYRKARFASRLQPDDW
ncbi:hypothetical protein HK104_000418, partial [Borealophlyctis nickersoniae]